ncbi:MAG: 16S rRNA (cytidine(1402)-2'-O)-methyltransferase [Patescibacteria group bacterium]
MPGNLYIVATPIGNLSDLTDRAKETLASVSIVLCEDTRVTKNLLDRFQIKTPTASLHQHTSQSSISNFLDDIVAGNDAAYVSDAGTPGISDPGGILVSEAVKRGIVCIPIPGACAAITALSVSGFPTDRFTFLGFPPQKNGRKSYFDAIAEIEETVVFYESKYRIEKALLALPQDRLMTVSRELTKIHETVYRGTAPEILSELKEGSAKGEFVVVLAPKKYGK